MTEFTKVTAQQLSSIIKRPALKDNLLSRPPFKFLFDIFVEVAKETGFSKGLYPG